MTTPFLPIAAFSGLFSVQNRTDEGGSLASYMAVRAVPQSQLQFGNTETPMVVFKLDRGIMAAMSVSIAAALASSATGSF